MKLELLGHACVVITSEVSGKRLMLDPYEPGGFGGKMAYLPITHEVDAVLCTHDHLDHCAVDGLPGSPPRLSIERREEGARDGREFMAARAPDGFEVSAFTLDHDEYGGRRFGGEVLACKITCDGWTLLHLSDVGHSPGVREVQWAGEVDVLLVPTGGLYTIGALQAVEWVERIGPKLIVPMHYQTSACHLPIGGLDLFLARLPPGIERIDPALDDHTICVDVCSCRLLLLTMQCEVSRTDPARARSELRLPERK